MKRGYLERKLKDIENEVAVAVGVANMVGVMFGVCNDSVIKARDEATAKIIKIVHKLIKHSRPLETATVTDRKSVV